MKYQPNTGEWMVQHGIDKRLLVWAKRETKHQFAKPPPCDNCGGELPVDKVNYQCPHCHADVVPF